MSDHTYELDALLRDLAYSASCGHKPWRIAALTALVAERDALKQRVAELEHLSKPVYITHGQRVESIDLRERLVCAALTGLCADPRWHGAEEVVVQIADRTLAAMRKGERP